MNILQAVRTLGTFAGQTTAAIVQSIPAPRFLPLSLGVYLGALSPMNDMNDKILRVALPLLTFLTYGPHFVPRDTQQGIPAILADFSLGTLVAYYLKVKSARMAGMPCCVSLGTKWGP